MLSMDFFSQTEYHRELEVGRARPESLQWLKRALPVLAAWINPDTDTYAVRGQDTLTFGDQARWIQLKGALAKTAALQDEVAPAFDFAEVAQEYAEIVQLLSRAQPVLANVSVAPDASLTARQALRLGDTAAAIALLEAWLDDRSGYDEAVWPQVKAAMEENRLSDRKLFSE